MLNTIIGKQLDDSWFSGSPDIGGMTGAQFVTRLPNHSSLFAMRLSFFAADGAVGFADAIRTQFHNAVLDAVLLVFARSQSALHQNVRTLRQRPSIFAKLAERHNAVPFCAALPLALLVLPRFLGRDRDRRNRSAVSG